MSKFSACCQAEVVDGVCQECGQPSIGFDFIIRGPEPPPVDLNHVRIVTRHPQFTHEMLGFIPSFLDVNDPRDARSQIDAKYLSGWNSFKGHKMLPDGSIKYPGDPPLPVLCEIHFRDEILLCYDYAWVAIKGSDGTFDIARLD